MISFFKLPVNQCKKKRPLQLCLCSDSFRFLKWPGLFSELAVAHLVSIFVCSEVKESPNLWRASPAGGAIRPSLLCRSQWQADRALQVPSTVPGSCGRDTAGWDHAVHNSQRDKAGEISAAGPAAAQVSAGWAAHHTSVVCHSYQAQYFCQKPVSLLVGPAHFFKALSCVLPKGISFCQLCGSARLWPTGLSIRLGCEELEFLTAVILPKHCWGKFAELSLKRQTCKIIWLLKFLDWVSSLSA